jgi:hypothetical protein
VHSYGESIATGITPRKDKKGGKINVNPVLYRGSFNTTAKSPDSGVVVHPQQLVSNTVKYGLRLCFNYFFC